MDIVEKIHCLNFSFFNFIRGLVVPYGIMEKSEGVEIIHDRE